jgi:hypothetical protein
VIGGGGGERKEKTAAALLGVLILKDKEVAKRYITRI